MNRIFWDDGLVDFPNVIFITLQLYILHLIIYDVPDHLAQTWVMFPGITCPQTRYIFFNDVPDHLAQF